MGLSFSVWDFNLYILMFCFCCFYFGSCLGEIPGEEHKYVLNKLKFKNSLAPLDRQLVGALGGGGRDMG